MPMTRLRPLPFTRFTSLGALLTVGQRGCYKVAFDGLDPCELEGEERRTAAEIFGEVERVPPAARRVFVQVKGRGIGGTRLGADRGAQIGLTIDPPNVPQDEQIYVFFGGPKLRHARIGLRFARAECHRQGVEFLEDTADHFTIRRHDGRLIRFEAFAASRGGDNVRGVHIAFALLTEAGFYYAEDGNANGEDIFAAIIPRLLDGGQIVIESTPWTEGSGLLWTEFTANWAAPMRALAAKCPTTLMRDDPATLGTVELERQRDPSNAQREFDAEFLPAGSGQFFDAGAVTACIDPTLPNPIPPEWRPTT